MTEDWLNRWFREMFGQHSNPYGFNRNRINPNQLRALKELLNNLEQPDYSTNIFNKQPNPFNIINEFYEIVTDYIDDMEINHQMEADMTIKRKGKTYLVNIKTIPSIDTDDDETEDSEESETSQEESAESDSDNNDSA